MLLTAYVTGSCAPTELTLLTITTVYVAGNCAPSELTLLTATTAQARHHEVIEEQEVQQLHGQEEQLRELMSCMYETWGGTPGGVTATAFHVRVWRGHNQPTATCTLGPSLVELLEGGGGISGIYAFTQSYGSGPIQTLQI